MFLIFLKYLFICSQSLREYIDPEEYSFILGIQSSSNLCKSAERTPSPLN